MSRYEIFICYSNKNKLNLGSRITSVSISISSLIEKRKELMYLDFGVLE